MTRSLAAACSQHSKAMARYTYDRVPILGATQRFFRRLREQRKERKWRQDGCPAPPPHTIKRQVVLDYARRHGCRLLVETGTYMGDMVEAMRSHFDRVYTIELSPSLYERACQRFAGIANIELIFGDSSKELPGLVAKLDQPTLFWLDGHFSAGETSKGDKETPISEELDCLLPRLARGDVLLIDDARLFGVDTDYPTIDAVRQWVGSYSPTALVEIENDIIRIVERSAAQAAA